jgi:hypothetical protein
MEPNYGVTIDNNVENNQSTSAMPVIALYLGMWVVSIGAFSYSYMKIKNRSNIFTYAIDKCIALFYTPPTQYENLMKQIKNFDKSTLYNISTESLNTSDIDSDDDINVTESDEEYLKSSKDSVDDLVKESNIDFESSNQESNDDFKNDFNNDVIKDEFKDEFKDESKCESKNKSKDEYEDESKYEENKIKDNIEEDTIKNIANVSEEIFESKPGRIETILNDIIKNTDNVLRKKEKNAKIIANDTNDSGKNKKMGVEIGKEVKGINYKDLGYDIIDSE